jgi:3-oxoacyl-[acyl-carrier-protein] synthase III
VSLLLPPPGRGVRIVATGSALPARVVTSRELAARPGAPLTEAEIAKLTGIEERRHVAEGEATSDLAIAAGRVVLERARLALGAEAPLSVDRLLLSTTSPDHPAPACACLVQRALGLAPCPACDVAAACAGFLFALDWGARAVLTGDGRVLVLAADVRSRFVDPLDRSTSALFGDGAGGLLLEAGPEGEGLLALQLASDGAGYETIQIPAGGSRRPASPETVAAHEHCLRMADGPRVFLTALEGMSETADRLLGALGLTLDEIDLVVPHQPNRMILERLARTMRLPREKLFENVSRRGNMSSASLAVALDEAVSTGAVRPGSRVLLLGAGAGYCAGAALVAFPR